MIRPRLREHPRGACDVGSTGDAAQLANLARFSLFCATDLTSFGDTAILSIILAGTIIRYGAAHINAIPNSTPKLLYVMALEGHFSWGTPRTNSNASGRYVLAWEKLFLEGDQRYKKFLLERGPLATTFQSNLR
jgi:hypothetical protein